MNDSSGCACATDTLLAAVDAYVRLGEAGLAGRYFAARYPGRCALTRSKIRPNMQVVSLAGFGQGLIRRDAVEALSIRGCDDTASIMRRFSWPDRDVAATWLSEGSVVIIVSEATLKPVVVRAKPTLGSVTLDRVTASQWRFAAFMLRRDSGSQPTTCAAGAKGFDDER